MRLAALTLIGALSVAAAASASAAPAVPNLDAQKSTNIVQAAFGCGWGFHPNPWGRCVPNHYGFYRPWWRHNSYYGGGYYGGGYYPYRHRYWYGY